MPRLPIPGGDDGTWGTILNDYLSEEHNADGTHKTIGVNQGGTGATDASTARTNLGAASTSDLTTHTNDTTSVHGIADTTALETTTGAQTKVDTHASASDPHPVYLLKAGGTMTGALTLSGDPGSALQAATKQYVDAAVGGGGISQGVANGMLVSDAEENLHAWEIQASTFSATRNFTNWHGEGYLTNQNNVSTSTNITISRNAALATGYAELQLPSAEPDFAKLADPATLPTGTGTGAAFSTDNTYLAIAHSTTPLVTIYKRSGDTFTKLADPATLPAGSPNEAAFSDDVTYLAIAHNVTPFVTIYKRSGDTFTKLADPATLPAGNAESVTWSSDGIYLIVGHATTPFVTIYKRSGDTFTKLANPATLPAGTVTGVDFSSDATYLATCHQTSPYVTIYKRSGDTFTKLANPATLPTSQGFEIGFSPDDIYLAVGLSASPYLIIYKRSVDTFTKLTDPASLPTGSGRGISFANNGTYLAVAHSTSPFITVYSRSGDTFTKLNTPTTLPADHANDAMFSANNAYLAVAHLTSPYVTIYKDMSLVEILTGNVTLTTRQLSASCNSVFIHHNNEIAAGGSIKYQVSLDGGTTFEEVVTTGQVVTLAHSGSQLIIKQQFDRTAETNAAVKSYWFIAWAVNVV